MLENPATDPCCNGTICTDDLGMEVEPHLTKRIETASFAT
jgi:hypothetical protein